MSNEKGLRNQLNGLLLLFMDVPASKKLVVAKKSLPEPEYFLIWKPCSSLPSGRLPTKWDVLKLIIWERDRYEKENRVKFVKIEKIVSCMAKHKEECSTKQSMLSCQSKGVLWVEDNITTLRDRQLLNNMPGMCGSWSDKDRMRLGAKLEDVVHHVKVQQMDASGAQGVHGLGLILPVQPPQSRSLTSRRRLLFLIIPTVAKYLVPEQYCK